MAKMSEVEFNPELKKVYDQIKDTNPSTLSTLKSTNETAITTLETKIKSCLDTITAADTWKDDVSTKLKTSSDTITDLISKCKEPGGSVLTAAQGATSNLQSGLADYDGKLEELNAKIRLYNSKEGNPPSPQYETDDDGNKTSTETASYKRWKSELTSLEEICQHMNDDLESLESTCKSLIAQLKGLLSPLDSDASSAALKMSIEITKTWLPSAGDIDEKFKDGGFEVTGTETLDANGKVVKRTYTVYDKDGVVVQTGVIEYDENEKEIKRTVKNYKDGVAFDPTGSPQPSGEPVASVSTSPNPSGSKTPKPSTSGTPKPSKTGSPTPTETPTPSTTPSPTPTESPTPEPTEDLTNVPKSVNSFDGAQPGDVLDGTVDGRNGTKNLIHNGQSNVIAGVTTMSELKAAAAAEQPIMITSGEFGLYWRTESFLHGNGVTTYKATPEEPIYLVMDTNGSYMVTNSKGEALNKERITKQQILSMSRTENEHNIWYGFGNMGDGILNSGDYSYFKEAE
jgi:hypothetical protein